MDQLLKPDTQIGPYRVVRHVGEGGMGEVYEAVDEVVGRTVALKVFRSRSDTNNVDHPMSRFVEEARTLAQINHPNIVSFFSIEDYQGTPCFAMEFVNGLSFRALCDKFILTPQEAMPLMVQILEGVRELHDNHILHRDLTPGNLILRPDGRVKILDFGIAKSLGRQTDRTQTGLVVGTPQYMAAEVYAGSPASARSDLWSVGAIFYEILTGERLLSKQGQLRDTVVKFNRECLSWIPLEIQKILIKLCANAVGERYGSAQEVISDLKIFSQLRPARQDGTSLVSLHKTVNNLIAVTKSLGTKGMSPILIKRAVTLAVMHQAQIRPVEGPEKTVATLQSHEMTLSQEVVNVSLQQLTQHYLRSGATASMRVHPEPSRASSIWLAGAICALAVVGLVYHSRPAPQPLATQVPPVRPAAPVVTARAPAAVIRAPVDASAELAIKAEIKLHELEAALHDLELAPQGNPELSVVDKNLADVQAEIAELDEKIKSIQTDAKEKSDDLARAQAARRDEFLAQRQAIKDRIEGLKDQKNTLRESGAPSSERHAVAAQIQEANEEWKRIQSEHDGEAAAQQTADPDSDAQSQLQPLLDQRQRLNGELTKLRAQYANLQDDQANKDGSRKKHIEELRQKLEAQRQIVATLRSGPPAATK